MTAEYILELGNVFHSGQVEPGTCLQKLVGSVRTGVILKDVSLEVHGGELTAILGSKGSGKRALLEVISRRAQGPTRGQILLNGSPMSMRLFQENCGYVTQKCDLLPGLSVYQTLRYAANLTIGRKVSAYVKESRVKVVLADLALSQLSNRTVSSISAPEYRRLCIGVQLVRDPILLLLDEPTSDLDPLNTYFIVSILSHHAKKYNRIVMLTMEKPRSDIFPFLDRVTYLCLGDVVYTGATRMMLDYFRSIGFPCPELENPLMYYLCLSTVDRRSRERFIESNNQISSLVEKFKLEGGPYRKYSGVGVDAENYELQQKVPLTAYGRPGFFIVLTNLIGRYWSQYNPLRLSGLKTTFLNLLLLPAFYLLLWIFYFPSHNTEKEYQRSFVTKNGLIFNSLAGAYFMAIIATVHTFRGLRTRYYQESREGIYSGPTFLVAHLLASLPISALSTAVASLILFRGLKTELVCSGSGEGSTCAPLSSYSYSELQGLDYTTENSWYPDFLLYWLAIWGCFLLAQQQTISILLVVRSRLSGGLVSVFLTTIYLALASCTLRTHTGLPELMYHITYILHSRYSGAILNRLEFYERQSLVGLGWRNETTAKEFPCIKDSYGFVCRYINGTHYLVERYSYPGVKLEELLEPWTNTAINLAFPFALAALNLVLYLVPLPAFVKAKFRE